MKSYKFNSDIIEWIQAFLTNRKQRVKLNSVFSPWRSVISGIPQGSILGPLLFAIFINDLPDTCNEINNIFLYADDAKLFHYIRDLHDHTKLQDMINHVQTWADKWQLSLNINKCAVVSYGRQIDNSYSYFIRKQGTDNKLQRFI